MAKVDPANVEYKFPDRGPKDYGTGQVYMKSYALEISAGDHVLIEAPTLTFEIRFWAYPDAGTVYEVEQSPMPSDTEEENLIFVPWDQLGDDSKNIYPLIPGNWLKVSVSAGVFKGTAEFWRG